MDDGLFVTIEGGEGCGKSYQTGVLSRRLEGMALPVVVTHEPGGTPFGEKITHLLKWDDEQTLSPVTETLLFNVSRAHLVENIIKPALEDGKIVICDRFTDSTLVYQGYARGLGLDMVNGINAMAAQGIKPDLSILLDIPAEQGLARKSQGEPDRYHRESLAFHRRVRIGFLKNALREPARWLYVDGRQGREEISRIIWERVSQLLVE